VVRVTLRWFQNHVALASPLSAAPLPQYQSWLLNRAFSEAARIILRCEEGQNAGPTPQMIHGLLKAHCKLDSESKELLHRAMEELNLSARAYDRILKVARTIADLASSESIRPPHLMEAIQYRTLDRSLWH
jgi:predicted ATPase with chaperone activity